MVDLCCTGERDDVTRNPQVCLRVVNRIEMPGARARSGAGDAGTSRRSRIWKDAKKHRGARSGSECDRLDCERCGESKLGDKGETKNHFFFLNLALGAHTHGEGSIYTN